MIYLQKLSELWYEKEMRYVVGLMSGTSVDGIDAALVSVKGCENPSVSLIKFCNIPFPKEVREEIFELFSCRKATVDRTGLMNVLLGELYAQAVLQVCRMADFDVEKLDVIGSHGQTIWHAPAYETKAGIPLHYTVQLGEGSILAARTGVPVVSDFRPADMAVGGEGAPLVPFTEYLLYRKPGKTVLLQNIGGIGNISVLPADAGPEKVFAFDTGPGNMMIDAWVSSNKTGQTMDLGGEIAARGQVIPELLEKLLEDPYYKRELPKSTGREHFGVQTVEQLKKEAARQRYSMEDVTATLTMLTARTIFDAYRFYIKPDYKASELIVGGGGSYNKTLLTYMKTLFETEGVLVSTQEDLGYNSDAKEAIAFALLADCTMGGRPNCLKNVTGAQRSAVLGKISYPPL